MYSRCVMNHFILQEAALNPNRTQHDPKGHSLRLAGHGGFISGIWQWFTQEQRGTSSLHHGCTPCAAAPTPLPSWELQSMQPVSKLALLVNGAATSGRVSQPNKILIGELLGNSLIWPEGPERVFCLAGDTDKAMATRYLLLTESSACVFCEIYLFFVLQQGLIYDWCVSCGLSFALRSRAVAANGHNCSSNMSNVQDECAETATQDISWILLTAICMVIFYTMKGGV